MAQETVRKHFILPKDLADEFEREAGARNQSETVAALIAEYLKRRDDASFFMAHAGFLPAEEHPEWATPADVNKWVRDQRAGWDSAGADAGLPDGGVDTLSA